MARFRLIPVSVEGVYYVTVMALVFTAAMLKEVNLLLILGGLMAGPLLFGWPMLVWNLGGLVAQRRVPEAVCAGDLLVARIGVSNPRHRASWAVAVEDQIGPCNAGRNGGGLRPGVFFPFLPGGNTREGMYQCRLPRRGRYQLGPLRLSSRFPFGLFTRAIAIGQPQTLLVFPRLGRLTGAWFVRRQESFAGTHRRERRHGAEGEFYGVRPWQAGDSRRWVHWRSTARAGKLVTRQFEQPRNRDVALVLDLWQPAAPQPAHRDHVELAVSFAATVVADLCRRGGSNVYLATAAPEPDVLGGPPSAALLQDSMQRLALVEASDDDRLVDLLRRVLQRTEPGTELVIVGTRPVDLADQRRFAPLWGDPGRRAALRRVRVVDTSSTELEQFFRPE